MNPAALRLQFDRRLRSRRHRRYLIGGSPLSILRLTTEGAETIGELGRGESIGSSPARARLVRRLLDNGMAHPVVTPDASARFTVVVPVRDDQQGLQTTLAGLADAHVVVVDDGSNPVAEVEPGPLRQMVRKGAPGGPAAARNLGIKAVTSDLIAFVDAGVEVTTDDLRALAGHFVDQTVVAVAPRIQSTAGEGWLHRYERKASPLDLGSDPARVRAGTRVSYVPTACLLVRARALQEVSVPTGYVFDPALRYGEDVDLVWRLATVGTVRYDPGVVVGHEPRPTLAAFMAQRRNYGSAAAALAARHGSAVAPFRTSAVSLAALSLLTVRRPLAAAAVVAGSTIHLGRKLPAGLPDAGAEAVRLVASALGASATGAASALWRSWFPATVGLALGIPRSRPPLLAALALVAGRRWTAAADHDPRAVLLGALDDASYGWGVWIGCLANRSTRALLPEIRGR